MKQSLSLFSFSFQKKRGEVVSLILIFIHIILIAVFFTLIFDTSIISNWLFVCTVTIVWYYRLIIFLYRLISFETLHCCCHHHQPGLRILTFSCNFLKSASGIVVRCPFVSIYQVHFSQRFYWPSLVWAATSPKKGSFSDRTSGMTILDGWLNWTAGRAP